MCVAYSVGRGVTCSGGPLQNLGGSLSIFGSQTAARARRAKHHTARVFFERGARLCATTMATGQGKPLPGEEPNIPLVQGTPIGMRAMNCDAVPLIDAETARVLASTDSFTIHQRPSFTEALCPALERSNIYDVFDTATAWPGAHRSQHGSLVRAAAS